MTERGGVAWQEARWSGRGAHPFQARLARYKKLASESGLGFEMSDQEALSFMRQACCFCGRTAGMDGNGLTRLRIFPNDWAGSRRGMGPFVPANVSPCCSSCNLMKGSHTARGFVEICCTIATYRGLGRDSIARKDCSAWSLPSDASPDSTDGHFGHFPERFPDNTSKRYRSSYLTDTKTYSLTNEEFREITSGPCYFCGKPSVEGKHQNGLDRLDSAIRVYSKESCVSCCGTCNVSKFRLSEQLFLAQCLKVARHTAALPCLPGEEQQQASEVEDNEDEGAEEEEGWMQALQDEEEEAKEAEGREEEHQANTHENAEYLKSYGGDSLI
eukprot:gb/GEZN01012656.1/.p1 GENE.gb/GEZN01012656.1/~~gb/GEZN01012656.1/.p1  ORF type:complete len:354 (-),score=68.94 gb/GEZN01012656.1/:2-988(-)